MRINEAEEANIDNKLNICKQMDFSLLNNNVYLCRKIKSL